MHQIQSTLKDKLTTNIGEVLQILQKIFVKNTQAYNEVISLKGQHQYWKTQKRGGTISFEQESIYLNQLFQKLTSLIDDISPEEIEAYELESAIFNKILIISRTAERKAVIQKLFSAKYYKEVDYLVPTETLDLATVNLYQIILFDDMDTNEDFFQHYDHCLENATPYILYFGQRRVSSGTGVTPKAYFTNSVFSLHARLNEMITYLKYKTE